jgi:hypothetical protein
VAGAGAPFLLEFVVKEGRDFSRYNPPGLQAHRPSRQSHSIHVQCASLIEDAAAS